MAAASAEPEVADAPTVTRAQIADSIMTAAKGIMVAVVALIMLGALFSTSIIAQPHQNNQPTDRVSENHTVAADGTATMNVSASHYYDDGEHAEVVTNASNGATLTEGTEYEFFTNGTVENLQSSEVTLNVTYSYYQQNTFEALTTNFANYGEIAFIMIGLGLIALGATVAFTYFGRFGSGGGR